MKFASKLFFVLLTALPLWVNAQAPQGPGPGARVQAFASPVVNPDRTVTFSLSAPGATSVQLNGQFQKQNQPMQKNTAGVWTITVGPIEPNIYPYNFVVDGTSVSDPKNINLFPNEGFKASLLEVPGDGSEVTAVRNIPHGDVSYQLYYSTTLKEMRPVIVYTPPGYQTSGKKYPVLYLVSGTTDTEETWFKVGRANIILDNLIAAKKAEPMIIVMPYGYMNMGAPGPKTPEVVEVYKTFSKETVDNIIPFVEKNFRVIADKDHRAIAGFSRGGGQSLFTALTNLNTFSYIGSYSAYLMPDAFAEYVKSTPEQLNKQLKLFFLGVGNEDFLYKEASDFMALLKDKGVNTKTLVTNGGHTWMNARHYLTETLQLYFNQ